MVAVSHQPLWQKGGNNNSEHRLTLTVETAGQRSKVDIKFDPNCMMRVDGLPKSGDLRKQLLINATKAMCLALVQTIYPNIKTLGEYQAGLHDGANPIQPVKFTLTGTDEDQSIMLDCAKKLGLENAEKPVSPLAAGDANSEEQSQQVPLAPTSGLN